MIEKNINILPCSRQVVSLMYKLKLHSWKTKFCKCVNCICGQKFSVKHVIFECPALKDLYCKNNLVVEEIDLDAILNGEKLHAIASILLQSEIRHIL